MNMHLVSEPGMRIDAEDPRINTLRQMTTEQLRHLGERQVVYLRGGMCDGEVRFVLFGADGTPLAQTDAAETALEVAAEHGLALISVH